MDALTNCGVDVLNVRGVESPTGTAIILLQPSGENSIIIVGGANQDWGEIDREIKESIGMAGALLLQREIPEEVNIELAKIANSSSVPVYLDAGGIDEPVSDDLISLVDVISPNETELARLTGLATDTDEGVKLAVEKLKTKGISKVLVKMGAKGSILFTPDYEIYQAAVPAPEVVDTTGAGDCFTAAFVVSILEGHDERTALTFAATAASLCIRKIGALPSLPTRKEVEEEYQHKE